MTGLLKQVGLMMLRSSHRIQQHCPLPADPHNPGTEAQARWSVADARSAVRVRFFRTVFLLHLGYLFCLLLCPVMLLTCSLPHLGGGHVRHGCSPDRDY